ncbi:MAG: hypothetical protein AAFY08_14705 [Planctomycetota bacterium]
MFKLHRSLILAFLAIGVLSASVAIGSFNGKYDTEGDWTVKFPSGFKASGTFEGDGKLGGKKFSLKSETDSGCDLDGKGKLPSKADKGKSKISGGKFTSDCGVSGKTKFSVDKGSGSLKENRKGDANGKVKVKGEGKGGFGDGAKFTASAKSSQ